MQGAPTADCHIKVPRMDYLRPKIKHKKKGGGTKRYYWFAFERLQISVKAKIYLKYNIMFSL